MLVNVMLRVKFRAFFFDFARFTKLAKLTLNPTAGIAYTVEDFNESEAPAIAKKIIDRNGVVLKVW